jgi:adenine-specific DNA-methyltransferase
MWRALRDRRLNGHKFRRQHPVGPFVLDFCCPAARLAIELDGGVHAAQAEQDAARTELLAANGYRVLRFPNDAVLHSLPSVLDQIRAALSPGRLTANARDQAPLSRARERGRG